MSSEVVLSAGNSVVCIKQFGGHVVSWRVGGEEVLFLSSKAVLDGSKAIRGGIPIVFPNFGPWELGPQHGVARIQDFEIDSITKGDEESSATLTLRDTELSRSMWNYTFRLTLTVTVAQNSLTMLMEVENTDSKPFSFTSLFHTYIRVSDFRKTTVSGLKGLRYIDKVNACEGVEEREQVTVFEKPVDRIYASAIDRHVIAEVASSRERAKSDHSSKRTKFDCILEKGNLPDTVLWNPNENEMKDMESNGHRRFVCVEAGSVLAPITLSPSEIWQGSQSLLLRAKF